MMPRFFGAPLFGLLDDESGLFAIRWCGDTLTRTNRDVIMIDKNHIDIERPRPVPNRKDFASPLGSGLPPIADFDSDANSTQSIDQFDFEFARNI